MRRCSLPIITVPLIATYKCNCVLGILLLLPSSIIHPLLAPEVGQHVNYDLTSIYILPPREPTSELPTARRLACVIIFVTLRYNKQEDRFLVTRSIVKT